MPADRRGIRRVTGKLQVVFKIIQGSVQMAKLGVQEAAVTDFSWGVREQ
jgi:hypothetical protein